MKKDRKQIFGKFKHFFTNLKQKKVNWKVLIPIGASIALVFVFVGCRVIPSLLANNVYSITDAGGSIDSLNPGDMINYNINGYSNWRILTVDKENGTVEVTSDSNVYNLTIDPSKSDEEINAIYQAEADKFVDDRYVINSRTISKADSLLIDTKGEYWVSNINENSLMTNKTGDQETRAIIRNSGDTLNKIYVFPYIKVNVNINNVPARGDTVNYSSNGINEWVYTGSNSYVNSTTRRLTYVSKYPVGLELNGIGEIRDAVYRYYSSFNSSGLYEYGNSYYYDYADAFNYDFSHITSNQSYFNGNDNIYIYVYSFRNNNVPTYDYSCQEKKYFMECNEISIHNLHSNGSIETWAILYPSKSKILTFGYRPVLTLRISDNSVGKSTNETLNIGDNVKYEANGYRNWKVLSINKNDGTVDVISGGVVKNISLYGKEDYENYEGVLQNEANSYVNGDNAVSARSVKESDIRLLNKINDNVGAMYWYNKKNVVNRSTSLNTYETSSNTSNYINSYEVGVIWTGAGDYYVNDINNTVSSSNISKYWVQLYCDGKDYNSFYYMGRGDLNYIAGLRPVVTLKYNSVKKLSNVKARKVDKSSKDYDNYYLTEQLFNNQSEGASSLLFRDVGKESNTSNNSVNNSINNNIYNKNNNVNVDPQYGTVRVDVGETNNVLNLAVTLAIIYGLIIVGLAVFIYMYRNNLINNKR